MSDDVKNQRTHQEEFRDALIEQLRIELVGPSEPLEILDESPRQRYSAGILFPSQQTNFEIEDEVSSIGEDASDRVGTEINSEYPEIQTSASLGSLPGREELTSENDETITMANTFMPSAMGITFICENTDIQLIVSTEAGIYKIGKKSIDDKELTVWQRQPVVIAPISLSLKLQNPSRTELRNFDVYEDLRLRSIVRPRSDGSLLITISLFNSKKISGGSFASPTKCYYQVGFSISGTGEEPIFRPYQELTSVPDDPEELGLQLLFRNRTSFGLGHGCAVAWDKSSGQNAKLIRTDSLPTIKIPPVEPRQTNGNELDMLILSGGADNVNTNIVPGILHRLANDYEEWIESQITAASTLESKFQIAAENHLKECRIACERIRNGISVLESSEDSLKAFCLMNQIMLMQQFHSRRKSRPYDEIWEEISGDYNPKESWMGRWRTFQIAFILMNIGSITPDKSNNYPKERDFVDLIWFPTGGGKTEAYLGLAAYTILLRRLIDPLNSGCTVLMRYTLRLLTSQQFQRASALICACEFIRQKHPEQLGNDRITIGLWVGHSLTPNTRQEALRTLNDLSVKPAYTENKFQLLKCPWCGTKLDDQRKFGYRATGRSPKLVRFVCPEAKCNFSSLTNPLPVMVVDEDIYEEPPTLLIGTVDKFAMLAWKEDAGKIFGTNDSSSPPELIIQDELHLISGPLGTVVGIFEGVIDLLCTDRLGKKPKIIGSTATIRGARGQCKALYNRPVFQFPPPGIDISDSYFATENRSAAGRLYTGIFASAAPSFVTANIRTSASLLQGCLSLDPPAGIDNAVRDPYWTFIQYFNSLKELGRALTLLQADIPEYMWTIASRSHVPRDRVRYLNRIEELTSRKTAQEIPQILEDLGIPYPREKGSENIPIDALLATNMISVGVDVDRLGLMSIVGQPKTTSEYIQASSRVGRSKNAPGLVITIYNPGKSRDRSHFEQFRAYHGSLYRHVEPTSVTPYSIPSIQRALHSVLIIVGRHICKWKNPEDADFNKPEARSAINSLIARCDKIDSEHLKDFKNRINSLEKHWLDIDFNGWGKFGDFDPADLPLMYPAGMTSLPEWKDYPWPTPTSMRSVDKESEAEILHVYPD